MFNIIKLILILIIIIICLQNPGNIKISETFRLNFELKHIEDKSDKLSMKLPLKTIKIDTLDNITNLSLTVHGDIDFKDNDIHIVYKKGYEYNPYLKKYLYYNVNLFMKKYIAYSTLSDDIATPQTPPPQTVRFSRYLKDTKKRQVVYQLYTYIKNNLAPKLENIKFTDTFNYKSNKILGQFTQLEPTTTNWNHPGSNTLIQNVNKFDVPIDPDDVTNYLNTQ